MNKLALTLAAALVMTGCAARSATLPAKDPTVAETATASPLSARQICLSAFSHSTILGWRGATVAGLRAYQYGGPVAHYPLKRAYIGVPPDHPGAWCLIGHADSASLWGAVPGRGARRAITVTGPGENRFRGELPDVPQVP